MKKTLFFLMFSTYVFAQSEYPAINMSGSGMISFVPPDWKIISNAVGDLNNDKLIDFAMVIEKREVIFSENDSTVTKENVLRILGVFLKQKNGSFFKHTQSNTFIISRENNDNAEPFQGIFITDEGYLDLNFQLWTKEKKNIINTHSFKFMLQNNIFYLVNYSLNESNRESGNSTDYFLNFLTKKMIVNNSNFLFDKTPTEEIVKLKGTPLKTFSSLKTPFEINIWE